MLTDFVLTIHLFFVCGISLTVLEARRSSFTKRNDSVETACSVGNQSVQTTAGTMGMFLGVPKSDSPALLAVPTGHNGKNERGADGHQAAGQQLLYP